MDVSYFVYWPIGSVQIFEKPAFVFRRVESESEKVNTLGWGRLPRVRDVMGHITQATGI